MIEKKKPRIEANHFQIESIIQNPKYKSEQCWCTTHDKDWEECKKEGPMSITFQQIRELTKERVIRIE